MRAALDRLRDMRGKTLAVDRQGPAGRDRGRVGRPKDQGAQSPHFLFEEPDRIPERVGAQGVAADKLSKQLGMMSRAENQGLHFM